MLKSENHLKQFFFQEEIKAIIFFTVSFCNTHFDHKRLRCTSQFALHRELACLLMLMVLAERRAETDVLLFKQIWSTVEFKSFVIDVFHFDFRQALNRDYFGNSFDHHRLSALLSARTISMSRQASPRCRANRLITGYCMVNGSWQAVTWACALWTEKLKCWNMFMSAKFKFPSLPVRE